MVRLVYQASAGSRGGQVDQDAQLPAESLERQLSRDRLAGSGTDVREAHPHALLFSSDNGARYLLDSATCTIHPWPWDVASGDLDGLYDTPDERLPSYLKRIGAPAELGRYVLLWRSKAGAFGRPKAVGQIRVFARMLSFSQLPGESLAGVVVAPCLWSLLQATKMPAC